MDVPRYSLRSRDVDAQPAQRHRSTIPQPAAQHRPRRARVSPYFGPRRRTTALVPPLLATDAGAGSDPKAGANAHHPRLPPHLAGHPSFAHEPGHFGLVQELLAHDPWALLVATCLLNKTRGTAARPMCWEILARWPTPAKLAQADELELSTLLYPLGLYRQRARRLRLFSQAYLSRPPSPDRLSEARDRDVAYLGPTPIAHLPGVGRYALESWFIFCAGPEAWRDVRPADKELKKYIEWRRAHDPPILES